MKSFTNEGADRHAGAPGPALPPDAAHEGGAGNDGAAATHEGGAADDPAGAAPPAEAAGVALPETPATAAPLLAAPEIQAAATAEEESQPRTRRPRPDDGQRVGTWRTARRGNQMYSSSCTLLDLRAGTEERQYVTEVILRFGEGRLPNVPDNTSLRVLLSTVLNCSPMRITKKFSGRNALPRGRYRRTAAPEPAAVWKSNFGRPTPSTRCCLRSCVCAMAWRFHAIDATLSPWPRRLDGVEAHEGPRNISQDNLTHWLISTQVRRAGPRGVPRQAEARVGPAVHHSDRDTRAALPPRGRLGRRDVRVVAVPAAPLFAGRVWLGGLGS